MFVDDELEVSDVEREGQRAKKKGRWMVQLSMELSLTQNGSKSGLSCISVDLFGYMKVEFEGLVFNLQHLTPPDLGSSSI